MTLEPYQQEYLALLGSVRGALPSAEELPKDQFAAALRDAQRASREAVERGTRILRESLFPVLDDILSASEAQLESLYAFASQLTTGQVQKDAGLNYRIHLALLQYARRSGDKDMLIRELYMMGMSLNNLQSMLLPVKLPLFSGRMRACFAEAAAYFEHGYDELENAETRGYVHRSMGNLSLSYDDRIPEQALSKLAVIDRSLRILTDPDVRAKTPSLPWDQYVYVTHQQRASALAYLRSGRADPKAFAEVLESALIVQDRQQRAMREKGLPPEPRWQYASLAARFHCGALLLSELLDGLYALSTARPEDDYGYQGLFARIGVPAYFMEYSRNLEEPRIDARFRQRAERMTRRMLAYITRAPGIDEGERLLFNVRNFLHAYRELPGGTSFFELVQSVFAARLPSGYVRMWIAGQVVRRLCEWALEDCPGEFSCVPNLPEAGEARRGALLEMARRCGRLYDAGMVHFFNLEAFSCRGLFEEEALVLQQHAFMGADLLLSHPSTAPYASVAHGHHVHYDGRGGFPLSFSLRDDPMRPMIYLVTVADALASSTEEAASRYRPVRTFDEALAELFSGEGTRYAPFAVELLRPAERRERLREDMRRWNEEAYLHLYRRRADNVRGEE